jgi:hypothetical protein
MQNSEGCRPGGASSGSLRWPAKEKKNAGDQDPGSDSWEAGDLSSLQGAVDFSAFKPSLERGAVLKRQSQNMLSRSLIIGNSGKSSRSRANGRLLFPGVIWITPLLVCRLFRSNPQFGRLFRGKCLGNDDLAHEKDFARNDTTPGKNDFNSQSAWG